MIDLRSDTVTKPTPAMLAAMSAASVGDDVYAEDPSINQLETEVAAYFGKEAGLFVPSGTMSNQIAVRLHCSPGTELYCDHTSHVILWEGGGPATLSGVTVRPIVGHFGKISRGQLEDLHRPDDIHSPVGRLVWLENTHNRGGGSVHSIEEVRGITAWAREQKLRTHLDGARLWNAIVATGVPGPMWAAEFDSVSVCFSKGLGAPVGSALLGTRDFIKEARRVRKLFGGAMRQAGFLAAACTYAMKHHIDRLAEDHANAKLIADAVRGLPGVQLVPETVDSNLVWFEIDAKRHGPPQVISAKMKERGVLMSALGSKTVRAVTHLDVSRTQCETAAAALRDVLVL
jgi:threonine aldolase